MKMKKILYCACFILIAGFLVIRYTNDGASLARANQAPISIVTATDLHFISTALNDNGPAFMKLLEGADGRVSQYIDELTDAFVEEVIATKPDLLVLSGDITFNGERKSHEDLAIKLKLVKDAGIEVLIIPGNHDIWNMSSIEFVGDSIDYVDTVTQKQFYEIYKDFGYTGASSRDEESLSYMYPIRDDVKLLMLDVNTDMTENVVLSTTLEWLEKELKKAKWSGEKVIAVVHQNVLPHSDVFTEGYMLLNADKVSEMFRKYGVEYVLSGHIHLQDIQSVNGLTEIATSSLALSPNQYGIVSFDGENFTYRTQPVNVNEWAKATGQTNPELLNFTEFSKKYFIDNAFNSAYNVAQELSVSEEDAVKMAEFYSYINSNYFAGTPSDVTNYKREIDLWANTQGRFTRYIESIVAVSKLNRQVYA